MKRIATIDPGVNGGIAWIDEDGIAQAQKMPDTLHDLIDSLRSLKVSGIDDMVIEKTGTYRPGNSGPAAAKFARHCGQVEGVAATLGFSVEQVPPATLMKKLGSLPKDKAERKLAIKNIVQLKYPHLKITLNTADALGILKVFATGGLK